MSTIALAVFLGAWVCCSPASAQETKFQYEVNADGIHIRCDSTVSSTVVCALKRGDVVEVVSEAYGWYKVRLPALAPTFIHKSMVASGDNQTAIVVRDNVNIRMGPGTSSPVVGKVKKDQPVAITSDQGDWYGIQPPPTAYGWINKKFVSKKITFAQPPQPPAQPQTQAASSPQPEILRLEGIIKPHGFFFKGPIAHKLQTGDNRVFLLKGDRKILDSLNNRKVKLTGVIDGAEKQKYPVLQIRGAEEIE